MKAVRFWGHDAYFDYVDRFMREDDPYKAARGTYPRPEGEGKTLDPFVTEMWKVYRKSAPEQEMSRNNLKWIWEGKKGKWIRILKCNPGQPVWERDTLYILKMKDVQCVSFCQGGFRLICLPELKTIANM